MNIITITINPAYDIHYYINNFNIGNEYKCKDYCKQAAGKGVNVSKALSDIGISSTAYIIVGNNNSKYFKEQLNAYKNIECIYMDIDGDIRENITIHSNNEETRVLQENICLKNEYVIDLFNLVFKQIDNESFVVFSGSIPNEVDKELLVSILKKIKNTCMHLIIDTNSFSYKQIKEISPWMIKPNLNEFLNIIDKNSIEGLNIKQLLKEKFDFCNVLLTLGKDGAYFSVNKEVFRVEVPEICSKSTIGAGDATVAGFLSSYIDKNDYEDALLNAVAFGSAKCLNYGTTIPNIQTIQSMKEKVIIKMI